MEYLDWIPADWRGPLLAALVAAGLATLWPVRGRLADLLLRRLGAPPRSGVSEETDARVWREADIKASGLPVPIICIDRHHRVRIYNRAAEDASGHPWNAAHGADVGLLLTDADAAALRRDLDANLRDRHGGGGAALRLVGSRRAVHLERPDGSVVPVVLLITDFGNGHGGWQLAVDTGGLDGAAAAAA